MALGGGTFTVQNKQLPGAYINFVSASSANAELSERGTVTMPIKLDWGKENEVFEVKAESFQRNSKELFGYEYTSEKLKGLRDLFKNAHTLYAYRIGGGEKASNDFAKAKYGGSRGNALSITISEEKENLFSVKTLLDGKEVDSQTVSSASELTDNPYLDFISSSKLSAAISVPLSGGTDKAFDEGDYADYLNKIEGYGFNVMAADVSDESLKAMLADFTKRMRDEMGVKFQLVLHNYAKADHMGVISVKNETTDENADKESLVYWTAGAEAGCPVNKSCQNKRYDGEFNVNVNYTQSELKAAVASGELIFHRVGAEIRMLEDKNTLTTLTNELGEVFCDNQTVRVTDQIANDIAVLFNTKYLGVVPNDSAGRVSLWADIVKHHERLKNIRAIENFSDSDVTVTEGETRKSVTVNDAVTVVNAMSKLYMTVNVS